MSGTLTLQWELSGGIHSIGIDDLKLYEFSNCEVLESDSVQSETVTEETYSLSSPTLSVTPILRYGGRGRDGRPKVPGYTVVSTGDTSERSVKEDSLACIFPCGLRK